MSDLLGMKQVRLRGSACLIAMVLTTLVVALPPMAVDAQPYAMPPTLREADWRAIKQVIGDQNRALRAGDAVKAFSYASPGIREQFGTPEHFLDMVRAAYGALIAARYSEFLEGAVVDGAVIQPLRLIAADNTVQVALYTMERQKDGRWRIAGCVLAPSTVQAA
jgi:Domain of unknown function (DUF4864)